MRWTDQMALAGGAISGNKLRSALTMLGVTIGVFSVVGVMTALSAVRQSIDSGLNVLGANTFMIDRYERNFSLGGGDRVRHRHITVDEFERFEAEMQGRAEAVVPEINDWGITYRYGNRSTNAGQGIVGSDEEVLFINNHELVMGRPFTRDEVLFARPVIILGHEPASELFPNENPLGRWVKADHASYQVIGVIEEKGTRMGNTQDDRAYVPYTRYVQDFGFPRWRTVIIKISAESAEAVDPLMEEATGIMRLVRGLDAMDKNDFGFLTNDALLDAFGEIAVTVGTGGLLISAIALLTAGVGIMNIMLVSVTERTREIGIRKSIGAQKRHVLRQFLIEAVVLCQGGGFLGIVLGAAVGNWVAQLMNVPMIIPWFWASVAFGTCLIIGVFFGLYPAWKAANLKPVEALRYE